MKTSRFVAFFGGLTFGLLTLSLVVQSPATEVGPDSLKNSDAAAASAAAGRADLLVITSQELAPAWSKFANWKTATGRPTVIVTTEAIEEQFEGCLLYTSPSPRDKRQSRMPSSA